jgi:copper homeostasis protein
MVRGMHAPASRPRDESDAERTPLLEICVETLAAAQAAARGGADRIEVCVDLASGGVTPSLGLLEEVLATISIPVHCMIRPRAGDFCYAEGELRAMERDVALAKAAGAAGVVFGVLTEHGTVDVTATSRLVVAARPMRVTFHRAFDVVLGLSRQPEAAVLEATLDDVIATGADILLTSGGTARVTDSTATVARLVEHAGGRMEIMAGSGVRSENAAVLWKATRVDALHASLRRPLSSPDAGNLLPEAPPTFVLRETDVQALAAEVQKCRFAATQRLT